MYVKINKSDCPNDLTAGLGKGFSKPSLVQFRRFYNCCEEIAQTVSTQSLLANNKVQPTISDKFLPVIFEKSELAQHQG